MKQLKPKKPAGRKINLKPTRRKQSQPASITRPVLAKPEDADAIIAPNESNQTNQTNPTNQTNQSNQTNPTNPTNQTNQITPYNENLLESARAEWQAGNWEELSRLDRSSLQDHPDRAKLALLAAVGRQHHGDNGAARQYARLALEWECSKKLVAQVLIAGVHNTLGRAAAAAGESPRTLKHFEAAVAVGATGSQSTLQTQARIARELEQMGLPGAVGLQLDRVITKKHEVLEKTIGQRIDATKKTVTQTASSISNYCIDSDYQSRTAYVHYDDMELQDNWQLEVYLHVYAVMKKNKFRSVADIGCGSAFKLMTYLAEFTTIGYELPDNVEILKKRYPDREWRVSDFDSDETLNVDVIVCSDVIEHLVDPDLLIRFLCKQEFKYLILSTPERDLVYASDDPGRRGPPRNIAHQREWNFSEFAAYIGHYFKIFDHRITNIAQATQMIICEKDGEDGFVKVGSS